MQAETGPWGNPFRIVNVGEVVAKPWWVEDGSHVWMFATKTEANEASVNLFRHSMTDHMRDKVRLALRGKHLACWCRPGEPCHADVLLEIANKEDST